MAIDIINGNDLVCDMCQLLKEALVIFEKDQKMSSLQELWICQDCLRDALHKFGGECDDDPRKE